MDATSCKLRQHDRRQCQLWNSALAACKTLASGANCRARVLCAAETPNAVKAVAAVERKPILSAPAPIKTNQPRASVAELTWPRSAGSMMRSLFGSQTRWHLVSKPGSSWIM